MPAQPTLPLGVPGFPFPPPPLPRVPPRIVTSGPGDMTLGPCNPHDLPIADGLRVEVGFEPRPWPLCSCCSQPMDLSPASWAHTNLMAEGGGQGSQPLAPSEGLPQTGGVGPSWADSSTEETVGSREPEVVPGGVPPCSPGAGPGAWSTLQVAGSDCDICELAAHPVYPALHFGDRGALPVTSWVGVLMLSV